MTDQEKYNNALKIVFILVLVVITLLVFLLLPGSLSFTKELFALEDSWYDLAGENYLDVERVFVSEVVDGDTIRLEDGRRVRYLNIDTPETKRPGTSIECYGPESTNRNVELVENKYIWMHGDRESRDRYDRLLRFVYIEEMTTYNVNQSVNATLVQEGYATAVFYSPNTTYKPQFERLEEAAKQDNVGLWANC